MGIKGFVWVGVVVGALALSLGGCKKEAAWEGVYVSSKDQSQLELKPEHKGTLTVGKVTTPDLSWEVAGEDKIVVHVPFPIEMFRISGGLRDQEGTEWKRKQGCFEYGCTIAFADGHAIFWTYTTPGLKSASMEGVLDYTMRLDRDDTYQYCAWSGGPIPPGVVP